MSDTHCADCGQPFPIHPPGYSGGTGYAIRAADNARTCYPCTNRAQLADLKDRTRPFTGYISSDLQTITTWTGGRLMDTTYEQTRLRRTRGVERTYVHVKARDVHGGRWWGNGDGPGMCITLRPLKS